MGVLLFHSISGIPNGSAELTVAVRRSKLVSKAKSLVRCQDLIVNRSELSGSGISSTSLNDGLTFSGVYEQEFKMKRYH